MPIPNNNSFRICSPGFIILVIVILLSSFPFWTGASNSLPERKNADFTDSPLTPKETINHRALHYWDTINFSDTVYSLSDVHMEKSVSEFITVLNNVEDSVTRREALSRFISKSIEYEKPFHLALKIISGLLDDPLSSHKSLILWIEFLETLQEFPIRDQALKERYDFKLEIALKNRPGALISDFEFITRENEVTRLYDTLLGSNGLILIFYDPDCLHCLEVINDLRNEPTVKEAVDKKIFPVIAIDAEDDRELWDQSKFTLPEGWTVGFNTDSILDRDIYYLMSSPSIYVVDPSFRVVGKEVSPAELLKLIRP